MGLVQHITASILCLAAFSAAIPHTGNNDQTVRSVVPYGAIIDRCTVPGTVALTFDDGPWIYTARTLEILRENGARVTFFINGQALGNIYAFAGLVQQALADGHQVASHTWSHPFLPALDRDAIVGEMTRLEVAFMDVIGAFPTYMRPPFLAVNGLVLSTMADLGYHVISASTDTKDYENDDPNLIHRSIEKFRNELNAGGTIVLAHDVHQQTVDTLLQAMLDEVRARGLTPVPVGECLGDSPGEWYRAW